VLALGGIALFSLARLDQKYKFLFSVEIPDGHSLGLPHLAISFDFMVHLPAPYQPKPKGTGQSAEPVPLHA